MVHMSTVNQKKSSNARLRELVEATGLKQIDVLDLLNKGQARPVPLSTFKAWIAKPGSVRIRVIPELWMNHAEQVLTQAIAQRNDR